MENLGSEISQKMRCAVKAKLIELGSGYIDDELPDYVMIMVANKRSKQQMITDLNLFLDGQTELFVTWLHEVLHKLQEVTLPGKKPKAAEKDDPSKKDKKDKKKDKKAKKTSESMSCSQESSTIEDVVAGSFIEKAKLLNIAAENSSMKSKKEESSRSETPPLPDVPSISEILEQSQKEKLKETQSKERELAEIQKQILETKKRIQDDEETDDMEQDEDFLNISKEPNDELDEPKLQTSKSPIIFDEPQGQLQEEQKDPGEKVEKVKAIEVPKDSRRSSDRKISVRERLGTKSSASLEKKPRQRREDREMYVPAAKRKEQEMEKRSRNRDQKSPPLRRRDRSRSDNRRKDRTPERKRIGSRVIVAPLKPEYASEPEEDKVVNSVIKIKPRPNVSPSRQACKNLLLRAVAEAQKSTVLARKKPDRLQNRSLSPSSRNQKLYTKSYRDRMNRDTLIRRLPKDNIVVQVKSNLSREGDEYIPEPVSDRGDSDADYVYIPQAINSGSNDEEILMDYDELNDNDSAGEAKPEEDDGHKNKTQFVVTLDDSDEFKARFKNRLGSKNGVEKKGKLNSSSKKSIGNRLKSKSPKPGINSPIGKKSELIDKYQKPKEIKKIIIRNDSEDDDFLSPKKALEKINSEHNEGGRTPPLPTTSKIGSLKRKRSPIKFDFRERGLEPTGSEARKRSRSSERSKKIESNVSSPCRVAKNNTDREGDRGRSSNQKISTRKSDREPKKYDNVPEFLSSVPIDSTIIKVIKTKDRCKYFPTCTKVDCEFYHPTMNCKAFPVCKFADKCLYIHPKCKYDLTCTNINCNFSHTPSHQALAPPLSSHVIPVQNYKSITSNMSSNSMPGGIPSMCKYYPKCTNNHCNFYHPKPCKFGRNCLNKMECNFYHPDVVASKDKFKWVASVV